MLYVTDLVLKALSKPSKNNISLSYTVIIVVAHDGAGFDVVSYFAAVRLVWLGIDFGVDVDVGFEIVDRYRCRSRYHRHYHHSLLHRCSGLHPSS